MIVPTPSNAILLLVIGVVFVHFMQAGARTLHFKAGDSGLGANLAEFSFIVTGIMVTWGLGLRMPIPVMNQVAAALVLTSSVALYEWARHTIWGRRFGVAMGEHVPESLCEAGPYRFIRHPLYLSYTLAFLAVLVALPHWITVLGFLFNVVLMALFARSDERAIAASPLAADYAAYRERTGMFFPRFSPAAPGR